ncbi:MAG: hypothetical protein LBC19_05200 [Tannerella sp.]|jgi:hypothetical protein|nr:hypothetical protein [Tannerella sp.]
MTRKVNVFVEIVAVLVLLLFAESCNKETVEPDQVDDEINCQCTASDDATVLQVGVDKPFKTIKAAAEAAGNNTVVEIDAGTYKGDVTVWTQDNLVIRSAGGEVILDADGKHVDGKGIWEMKGGKVCVEGITFINAKAPDQNGAGIRLSNGQLTVTGCRFLHNEMGILTNNEQSISLTVRNSEFGYGGYGDGYSHNMYVGHISMADISGCWFHHAANGHLIKSRAALSHIYCNLIADGNDADARASYEIDIPSGGQAVIAGNIIQKSPTPENPHVINFARESNTYYPVNRIFIAHNTVINNHNGSNDRLLGAPQSGVEIYILNNAIQENTKFDTSIPVTAEKGNIFYKSGELSADYYPVATVVENWKSRFEKNINSYLPQDLKAKSLSLTPSHQYIDPMNTQKLTGTPAIPGAIQTH